MSETQLDLSRLAIDRSAQPDVIHGSRRATRKWITRYAVPFAILVGFAALLFAAAGRSLWPVQKVEFVPVIVKRATLQQSSGTPLFQAAGWIEPRPTATNVPALAPGVVQDLLVVEGQLVKQGEPIAHLISVDFEIAVKEAEALLSTAEGELKRAIAEEKAAKVRLEQPVHLQAQHADAKSLLAKAETELANLPFQIESAQANFEYARKSVQGKRAAGKAVPGVILKKAESELESADAKLRELKEREPSLRRQIEAHQDKVAAIKSQLDLLVEETRLLEEAQARLQSASARRETAALAVERAKLELERTTVRAPIDGRILRLIAFPGMRVMGLEVKGGHDSSSVVEMYDPDRLQVRADVRLEDVPLVQPGQPVEIETASSEKTIQGRVLQSNSTANIQKNTLEVKVELLQPPKTVRPEMLVTATFLTPDRPDKNPTKLEVSERLFVPRQLVQSDDTGHYVWTVDAAGKARFVAVEVGTETAEGLLEVTSGLQVTDKLISSETTNLRDGMSVEVSGEDRSLGR